jgi:hypothetical protein
MRVSRSAKRCLAALFGAVLLLCQSMAFADACVSGAAAGDSAAAPCHGSGEPAKGSARVHCQDASPASGFSVDLHPVTALPPSPVKVVLTEASASPFVPEPPQLSFEPPPLRLILCCLRN